MLFFLPSNVIFTVATKKWPFAAASQRKVKLTPGNLTKIQEFFITKGNV